MDVRRRLDCYASGGTLRRRIIFLPRFGVYAASRAQNKEGYRSGQEYYHFNREMAATTTSYARNGCCRWMTEAKAFALVCLTICFVGERRRGESDEVREIIQICPSFPARLVLKIESAGYRIRNPPSPFSTLRLLSSPDTTALNR